MGPVGPLMFPRDPTPLAQARHSARARPRQWDRTNGRWGDEEECRCEGGKQSASRYRGIYISSIYIYIVYIGICLFIHLCMPEYVYLHLRLGRRDPALASCSTHLPCRRRTADHDITGSEKPAKQHPIVSM
jgi:hypothetical protein